METQKTPKAKVILSKRSNIGGIIPDFKIYYRAIVRRTAWYRNRQIDQWNRMEYSEISPNRWCYLILDKGAKDIYWKKVFLTNAAGTPG
jgi:hypothetical protein